MSDRRLLYVAAFLRAIASGTVGVLVGLHLAARGFDPEETGAVVSVGLAGAALAALLVTIRGDRLGRRRTLVAIAVLGALGGVGVALLRGRAAVFGAAFVGMLNGVGKDRGAALILDQAALPTTTTDAGRTQAFAWYSVLQDAGHAVGALAAGAPALLRRAAPLDVSDSLAIAMLAYAALLAATAIVYTRLSPAVDARPRDVAPRRAIQPETRRVLWRVGALFAVDSLAGGFLTTALLSLYLYQRFDLDEVTVGALFFAARVINAGSHLGAAWLARRIGLVNTMVFTHIPSSLLLVTVAIAPSFPIAATLFLLREGLVEMDVPTRQSYVMAVVAPADRTFAAGVTYLVRLGAWAVAPTFAGAMMHGASMSYPLYIGAAMKIAYDILLYLAFRRHRPPEERS
jgi:MFS family permease